MARSLEEIIAGKPVVDRAKLDATTEDDIRRHMAEDGQDPDGSLPTFVRRRPGQRGAGRKTCKVQVTLRIDASALDAWRASGEGWTTRAADVLAREAPRARRKAG